MVLDQWIQWLHCASIHVAILIETKWSEDFTWSDASYHYVHSAIPKSQAKTNSGGILVAVSQSIASSLSLRFLAIQPGRLLRVSFPIKGKTDRCLKRAGYASESMVSGALMPAG